VVHPFSKSFVSLTPYPKYPAVTNSMGIVLDAILPLTLILLFGRVRSAYRMPIVMTAIVALATEGLYLIAYTTAESGGDPTELVRLGVSKPLLVTIGILMLGAGATIAGVFAPLLGIRMEDSIRTRIIILESGIISYLCLGIIFRAMYIPEGAVVWCRYTGLASIALLIAGVISRIAQQHIRLFNIVDTVNIEWNHVVFAMILGILAIAVPLSLV
jgi:hypothetical protein